MSSTSKEKAHPKIKHMKNDFSMPCPTTTKKTFLTTGF